MLNALSEIAKRRLGPRGFDALRSGYLRLKGSSAPLIRLVRGSFTPGELRAHLAARVGEDFEILFVHSSVNGLRPMYTAGARALVDMLVDWVGPQRTLAMPAFYFGDPAIGSAGATFAARPLFDLQATPSQMGGTTEIFRRMPGVLQSRNPIYRISALGPLARDLTAGHETSTTLCGHGTPFDFMANRRTRIVGIGKHCEVLTQLHHAEHILGDTFPVPQGKGTPLAMTLIDDGEAVPYHLPGGGPRWRRNTFGARKIMGPPELMEWTFHGAPMFTVEAAEVSHAVFAGAARGVTIYDRP